ncbi:DUF5706 domain-containing protein [Mitsuaria sp. CC2]|uniref:Pycsar system effector family protein n=1 Tax=Mitsuaria sp. CC2 TaxID=3029186 RepID=UPI003B8ACED8
MIDTNQRLLTTQWVMERQLAWIAASEAKVAAVVGIDIAMLGAIGAAFSSAKLPLTGVFLAEWLVTVLATLCLGAGIFCAAMAVVPRMDGPKHSLLFFARIAGLPADQYVDRMRSDTDRALQDDWAAQAHRNAEIAAAKFGWVQRGIRWSFLGVPFWFAAILTLMQLGNAK